MQAESALGYECIWVTMTMNVDIISRRNSLRTEIVTSRSNQKLLAYQLGVRDPQVRRMSVFLFSQIDE